MKRVSDYSYEVDLKELITVVVIPKSFGDSLPSVIGNLDSREITRLPEPETAFSFKFTVNQDKHRLGIEGAFLNAPLGAKYEVNLQGSKGGEFFRTLYNSREPDYFNQLHSHRWAEIKIRKGVFVEIRRYARGVLLLYWEG